MFSEFRLNRNVKIVLAYWSYKNGLKNWSQVVHGGSLFSKSVLVDKYVKKKIGELSDLAPLHNPVNLMGIEHTEHLYPGLNQKAFQLKSFLQKEKEFNKIILKVFRKKKERKKDLF